MFKELINIVNMDHFQSAIYQNYERLYSNLIDCALKGIFMDNNFYVAIKNAERDALQECIVRMKGQNLYFDEFIRHSVTRGILNNDLPLINLIIKLIDEAVSESDFSMHLCTLVEYFIKNQPVDSFRISHIEYMIELLYRFKNPICVNTISKVATITTIDEVSVYAVKAIALLAAIGTKEARDAVSLFKYSSNEDIAEEAERILHIW